MHQSCVMMQWLNILRDCLEFSPYMTRAHQWTNASKNPGPPPSLLQQTLREKAQFLVAWLYNPLCPSVGRSVHRLVTLYFFGDYGLFWGYCSCPIAWLVYLITAPAHPQCWMVETQKINNSHQSCNFAFLQFAFNFLAKITKLYHILTKKIIILNFCHFLQRPEFWPIDPLAIRQKSQLF